MNTVALAETRAVTLERLDRAGWWAIMAGVAALQLSIAVAQIALTIAALAWVTRAALAGPPELPRFAWPLAVYAGLTLLSAALSRDPSVSVPDTTEANHRGESQLVRQDDLQAKTVTPPNMRLGP